MLLLASFPAHADTYVAPTGCAAEVGLERISGRGRSIEYFVSIRHNAPTARANVAWSYAIDYTDEGRTPHTLRGKANLAVANSSQVLRSRAAVNSPLPPVKVVTGHQITDITCSYNG